MAVAGGLAGAPIRMAKAVTVDLDVPADAEIVIEGLIDPDLLEPEGPFGESHGHVALEDFNMSMRVTAITHRRVAGVRVDHQPGDAERDRACSRRWPMEPLFLTHLREQLSIKGVRRVVMHEPLSNLRKVIFVQYARGTPRTEVWRGLHGAATLLADCGKICIAVSEDIDPTNTDAVFWSLAYRSIRSRMCTSRPIAPPGTGRNPAAQRGVDHSHRRDARSTRRRRWRCRRANSWNARAAIWQELGLPALTPQPPWHGYSLGDWSDELGAYARTRRGGRMGAERRGNVRAPTRRADPGDAGARGRGKESKD